MRSITRLSTFSLALAASAPALIPSVARAGGFSATRFGGEDGHAATSDPTAVFYNPAGVAYASGTHAYVEGFFAYRTVDYNRDAGAIDDVGTGVTGTPPDATDRNSGKATLANPIASPFVGITSGGLVDGLGVGLAISVPFGGQANWDKDSRFASDATYPGAVDSSARWASIEGEQRSLYYSLAAGWRTRDGRFGVGGSVNLVQSKIDLVRARNFDGTDHLVRADGAIAEGRSLLQVDSLDLAAAIGVMWKPTPCSRVGLSYHSQPNFGDMTLSGTLTNQFGDASPTTIDVEMRQALPDVIRLAGVWRARDKVVLHASIDYQRWSKFKNQCFTTPGAPAGTCTADSEGMVVDSSPLILNIPRAWKDTIGARAGASYDVSDDLSINGGVLYDTNAVPDATLDPALIDMDKVVPQLGMRLTTGKVDLHATLGHVFYMSRTTAPRATDPGGKNRNPDMAGDYATAVTYVLLGAGVSM